MRCSGSQSVIVSVKSTPPPKLARRMPPSCGRSSVAASGGGKPIDVYSARPRSSARMVSTSAISSHTRAGDAAISIVVTDSANRSGDSSRRSSGERRNGSTRTAPISRRRSRASARARRCAKSPPAAAPARMNGSAITMQIVPSNPVAKRNPIATITGSQPDIAATAACSDCIPRAMRYPTPNGMPKRKLIETRISNESETGSFRAKIP